MTLDELRKGLTSGWKWHKTREPDGCRVGREVSCVGHRAHQKSIRGGGKKRGHSLTTKGLEGPLRSRRRAKLRIPFHRSLSRGKGEIISWTRSEAEERRPKMNKTF